jgi:hypothetical protein
MDHEGPGPLLRAGVLLSACLFILAAPVTGYIGLTRFLDEVGTLSWPSVPGKITKVITEQTNPELDDDSRFRPGVYYDYEVNGTKYSGKGIFVDDRTFRKPEQAFEASAPFPFDSSHPVYYQPSNPQRTVLVPGTTTMGWVWLLSPFPLAGIGALLTWGWLVVRRDLKKKKVPSEFDI